MGYISKKVAAYGQFVLVLLLKQYYNVTVTCEATINAL